MSVPSLYDNGTISVTNGSKAFTGSGTAWSTQLKQGTHINIGGMIGVVDSITSDTAGLFRANWPGTTQAGVAYVATTWSDGGEIAEYVRTLMERLVGKGLGIVSAGSPVASNFQTNDLVFDRSNSILYIKDQGVLKTLLSAGGYDAVGSVGSSPSDRDQYDDGQGDLTTYKGKGLTFFSVTEGGFYILLVPDTGGGATWSELISIRGVGDKYTIAISIAGRPRVGEKFRHQFEAAVSFASGFTGSQAGADDASTGTAVFSVKKNGVQIGTVTFDGSTAGVFALSSETVFEAGDVMHVVAPDPRDATLSGISFSFAGDRSSV